MIHIAVNVAHILVIMISALIFSHILFYIPVYLSVIMNTAVFVSTKLAPS